MIKQFILLFLLIITCLTLSAQSNDSWIAFWNKDSTLIGYKDKNGNIKIAPRFSENIRADRFDHIIAAMDNEHSKGYYLTKNGRAVGIDSLYIFDNGVDCESEGFICFRDYKTNKAGIFNGNGDIVIPAEYSDLSNVRNGMIMAVKGTEELLIDTLNHVLIDSFPLNNDLDFFSIQKTKIPSADSSRKYFLARGGSFYSFVSFEKSFKQWLAKELLANPTKQELINASMDTLTVWNSSDRTWEKRDRKQFINNNFEIIKTGLIEIFNPNCEYFIVKEGLNPFIYNGVTYEKYFDNCGNPKDWKYPVMDIVVSHKSGKSTTQNHYEFLRTEKGYRLISVTVRNAEIK